MIALENFHYGFGQHYKWLSLQISGGVSQNHRVWWRGAWGWYKKIEGGKSGDLSPPGCARCVNLNGGGVKLRGFAERSKGVMKFYWQALFNAYHWLNIFKTLWFKIIMTNYNRDMKFGYFFKAHLTGLGYGNCHTETPPLPQIVSYLCM